VLWSSDDELLALSERELFTCVVGDVGMVRILDILERNGFDDVVILDHTPQMSCAAPWHAGMAHTPRFCGGGACRSEKTQSNRCPESLLTGRRYTLEREPPRRQGR